MKKRPNKVSIKTLNDINMGIKLTYELKSHINGNTKNKSQKCGNKY
jgi:hypothetical protein